MIHQRTARWTSTRCYLIESCPEEDVDGDGTPAMDDCDDQIQTEWSYSDGDGYSNCAGDCNINDGSISFAGDSYGDGIDSDCDGIDICDLVCSTGLFFSYCTASTWQNALETCIERGYDGLATIINEDENTVHELLPVHPKWSGMFWIGLNDVLVEE